MKQIILGSGFQLRGVALALSFTLVALLGGEQWSAQVQKKPLGKMGKGGANTPIHKGLDFAASKFKLKGEDHLLVRLRNGKTKMGGSTISVPLTSSAIVQVGRIDIAKPMSAINTKEDGAHLFDTFVEKSNTYEIFYHVKNGKLEPNVTVALKEKQE